MLTLLLLFYTYNCIHSCFGQPGSALYEYVHLDDGMFEFSELTMYDQAGYNTYVFNMTSQKWFNETWTNKPVWYHHVVVHIPDVLNTDFLENSFLFVGSGSEGDTIPGPGDYQVYDVGVYANRTGMVTGIIKQVPFQPSVFADDPAQEWKREDKLIAWTWANYLEDRTDDPVTLLRFPMVKAVSKAMDLMAIVAANKTNGVANLDKFMISGASKRGWTTWLMPAADERVVAIAPMVLSCLNMNMNMHHYWESMGNWTFLFVDYWEVGVPSYGDHPRYLSMLGHVDPYEYREVLTVPKLMISGAMDEYFMMDDYDYFFDDLVGEKYIWLLENTGHNVNSSPLYEDVWRMLETYYIAIIKGRARPTFTWERFVEQSTGEGYIEVVLDEPATSVSAWMADTPDVVSPRRDFRQYMLGDNGESVNTGIVWNEFVATEILPNRWRATFQKPDEGYRGFYLKMNFPYPEEGREFIFTSQAQILSFDSDREFPFDPCTLEACQGHLV